MNIETLEKRLASKRTALADYQKNIVYFSNGGRSHPGELSANKRLVVQLQQEISDLENKILTEKSS